MALAQSPFSMPWVLAICLPVLFALQASAKGFRPGFVIGWLAGLGYFALALFWITQPFQVDVDRHGWMAPFALALMAGGMALFWGAGFGIAALVDRKGWRNVIILAACLTLAEWARSNVLTGFPWALVGYSWVETPLAQNAAWLGPHGLGWVTLLAGFAIALAHWRALVWAVAAVAALAAFGTWRLPAEAEIRDPLLTVRLVQPNAEQSSKWDPEMAGFYHQRLLDFSAARADPHPDIVIWPETAVPFMLSLSAGAMAEIAAWASPATVIMGIRDLEDHDGAQRVFNSLVVLDPYGGTAARYDKHHLVPFGEYTPYSAWIGGLGLPGLTADTLFGFTPGQGPQLIEVAGVPPFLPLICYESIFPNAMTAPQGRAEWLVQITNDAWFGTATGPYQHLAQARMRAIEQGLPLARVANTGISAMIDPFGRVLARLDLGDAGYLDAQLPAPLDATIYVRFGDLPILILLLASLAVTIAWRPRE